MSPGKFRRFGTLNKKDISTGCDGRPPEKKNQTERLGAALSGVFLHWRPQICSGYGAASKHTARGNRIDFQYKILHTVLWSSSIIFRTSCGPVLSAPFVPGSLAYALQVEIAYSFGLLGRRVLSNISTPNAGYKDLSHSVLGYKKYKTSPSPCPLVQITTSTASRDSVTVETQKMHPLEVEDKALGEDVEVGLASKEVRLISLTAVRHNRQYSDARRTSHGKR